MACLRVSHRWVALVFGILLIVVTTSGALLLYKPELERLLSPTTFHRTDTGRTISAQAALAIVQRERPRFGGTSVGWNHGVWEVPDAEYTRFVAVDPGTGRINGVREPTAVFAFLDNLHECALSCEGLPGYVSQLNATMPGLGIPGLEKLTVGGFVLGVSGLVFILLVVGGLILWWPGVRRWRRGFQVRASKGRYARDFDLHKLVGFVALPFLALWAFTGANFELPVVHKVTDFLLPGQQPTATFASLPRAKGTPDITLAQATRSVQRAYPGGRIVSATLPAKDDPAGTFSFCVDQGFNWWRAYPGCPSAKFAAVDRHDASRVRDTWHSDNLAQFAFGKQTEAAHFGSIAGWLPRLLFLVMGLVPVLLAVTGLSTWLYKRARRKRRRSPLPRAAA